MPPTDPQDDNGESTRSPDRRKLRAQAIARGRLEAMRTRAGRIRRTVAAISVALFLAAFLGVYVQLASGHDPALDAAARKRAATTLSSAAENAANGSVESATSEAGSSSGEEEASRESSGPSAVRTGQS